LTVPPLGAGTNQDGDSLTDDRLIDEQIAYYRARATEYDATSTPEGDPFEVETDRIRDALRAFAPIGRVLELAAGTGQWTGILAETADELLVTDASGEMLELNRARVGESPNVRYSVIDALAPTAIGPFDAIFFGFFLSHVPADRLATFWEALGALLAPAGRVFFVDEGHHDHWREEWIDRKAGIVRRQLTDGSVHRAVKVLWRPRDLERRLRQLGWAASVTTEGPFYWGTATRTGAIPTRRAERR
jgi:demethylmenaquinone methyltransferase/2-methoxy-6-polyprenyl-1,4-benzoquinol methylase